MRAIRNNSQRIIHVPEDDFEDAENEVETSQSYTRMIFRKSCFREVEFFFRFRWVLAWVVILLVYRIA